jgi:flagellin
MIGISNNSPANMAAYNFGTARTNLATSLTRLSSGNRINSAAEDPSGAAVSLRLRNQITGTSITKSSLQNVASFLEVQHTSLLKLAEIYKRMDEFRVKRLDPIASAEEIAFYNAQISQYRDQILEVKEETFNGTRLFSPDHNLLTMSADTGAVNGAAESVAQFNLFYQNPPLPIEFIFLADISGSMGPYIDNVISSVDSFISSVASRLNASSWSAKAVGYRLDSGPVHTFRSPSGGVFVSNDVDALRSQLQQLRSQVAGGVGNLGESLIDGVNDAINVAGGWQDPSATRVLIGFTDEPSEPPLSPGVTISNVASQLQSERVQFRLFTNNPADPETNQLTSQSNATVGSLASANANMQAALNGIIDSLITTDLVDFDTIARYIAENVSKQNTVRNLIQSSDLSILNASSAHSRIADLDVAAESIRLTRANIMQQAGGMAVNQVRVSADSVLTLLR